MIITKETDYALRILCALLDGELHTVEQITQDELLPQSFTYKILKKLDNELRSHSLQEILTGT